MDVTLRLLHVLMIMATGADQKTNRIMIIMINMIQAQPITMRILPTVTKMMKKHIRMTTIVK